MRWFLLCAPVFFMVGCTKVDVFIDGEPSTCVETAACQPQEQFVLKKKVIAKKKTCETAEVVEVAPCPPVPNSCYTLERNWFLQGTAGYYWPFWDRFHDIYGGGGIYGVAISNALPEGLSGHLFQTLYGWVDGQYFSKSGKTIGSPQYDTRLTMVPFSFGLEYKPHLQYSFNSGYCVTMRPFVGLGLQVTYLHIHNKVPFGPAHVNNWGTGGVIKFGWGFDFPRYWVVDIFSTFSYMKVKSNNLSGGVLGAAVGCSW